MRPTKLPNRKKKCVHGRHRGISRRKSNAIVWGVQNEVSLLSLDNMNEVIRVVKTQRIKGKRWWKVMPKDSCEVYKSRKRRHSHDRRKKDDIDTTDESVIQDENENPNGKSRKQNKPKSDREVRFRKIKKKRSSECSSASSTTVSTTSTMSTSSSCLYEMDYE